MKHLALLFVHLTMHNWAHRYGAQGLDPHDVGGRGGGSTESISWRCKTHFRLELVSLAGDWETYVHYASEDGTTVLPYDNCTKVTWFERDTESEAVQIHQAVTVGTEESVIIGYQNSGDYHDFFGVLTVTMTQKPNSTLPLYEKVNSIDNGHMNHGSQSSPPPKMCIFYVGASAPLKPVVYAYGFHNASCAIRTPEIVIRPYGLIAK